MYNTLLVVVFIAVLAPIASSLVGRIVRIPVVVIEILLGLLCGPAALNIVGNLELVGHIADIGLVMLFFMAGTEIDFTSIKGRPLKRSGIGWLISIGVGVLIGIVLAPTVPAGVYIGIALSSTALGTLLPVLIDAGQLHTPIGVAISAAGAVGEFGPLLAISIFLSSRKPGAATVVVLVFGVVALAAVLLAARGHHRRLHSIITATLHTSAQFAVRIVILIVAALVSLSIGLDLDMLLGAFAAGVVVQVLLSSAERSPAAEVKSKLDAVAFGLFVPVFFISTGINFDLPALLADTRSLILLGVFFVLLVVVRGLPGLLSAPPGATGKERSRRR